MKKVISFVLVLALVLGSFSMAFAAPATTGLSDVEGDANEAAITVVNDLGIVTGYENGSFQPDKAVTRAEFAAMITRALAIPESALAGYTTTTFKDTTGYGWAVKYLAFCESKGIMLGDGNGNAMPGKTINVNEAMTMVLRALGLTNNSAILVGSWPSNYVTVAQKDGLYDDVDAVATVDRAAAAQIIYNALKVNMYVVNADGDTTQNAGNGKLITALGCRISPIDIVDYDMDSLIVLTEYVGAHADIYINDDDEVVAVDVLSTFVEGSFTTDGALKFDGNDDVTYKVATNGVTAAVTASAPAVYILNLEDQGADIDDADGLLATSASSVKIAADVTGKTITKIYSVAKWDVTEANMADEYVQDDINDNQTLLGKSFALDKSDDIDLTKFALYGVSSLDKIKEDDVVYVYTYGDDADADIVKVEVGTKTVEGQVTKTFKDDDAKDVWVVAGNEYYISTEDGADAPLTVKDSGTAYLDYAGDIYYWDPTDPAAENYAVVTGTRAALGRDATIVLLDKNGTEKEYVLTSDADDATTAAITAGSIVTFALDKNGKVEEINAVGTTTLEGKTAKDASLIGKNIVASGIVVFVYDANNDAYSLDKVANFNTDKLIEDVTHAAVLDGTKIVALVVDDSILGGSNASYGIITKNDAFGLDADDTKVQLLNVFVDGKEMKDVLTTKTTTHYANTTTAAAELKEIKIDADGVITEINTADVTSVAALDMTTAASVSGKIVTVEGTYSYRVADDAVIYVYDADNGWEVKALSAVKRLENVVFYDTDEDTTGFDVLMAW